MTRHRRSSSVLAVLEDDDLLWEILLRLPPQPSSLPCASVVSNRWRRLVTDPRFLHQFYKHHQKPPLLGVFKYSEGIVFAPVLDPPDRIPPARFDIVRYGGHRDDDDSVFRFPIENNVLGCRHGLVLVGDYLWRKFVVCDPITSEQCPVAAPSELWGECFNGAVLCVDRNKGHVHGACHSTPSPFKVVLVSMYREYTENYGQPIARVYSSETNTWSSLISIEVSHNKCSHIRPSTLVGNVLYWPLHNWGDNILEFDFDTQNLTVIKGPPSMNDSGNFQII
ncbi:uncharacterized protein [Aegilops tauschii subsp. strangulata]|uniref:uncharacterized protein n=1 Tax=Aegilops tauschii subsp. strangulata TaxID=200361 RepID=UPI00098B7E6B|nr:uncharacterized protein LOC109776793 [Aegilops tauschii subsp. strangulata]